MAKSKCTNGDEMSHDPVIIELVIEEASNALSTWQYYINVEV